MNGAFGDERYGFSSTERTVNVRVGQPSASARARASSRATTFAEALAPVVEVLAGGDLGAADGDELGVERRRGGGAEVDVPVVGGDERDPLALALDDQRTDGLCTRPAERPRLTRRQSTGDTS